MVDESKIVVGNIRIPFFIFPFIVYKTPVSVHGKEYTIARRRDLIPLLGDIVFCTLKKVDDGKILFYWKWRMQQATMRAGTIDGSPIFAMDNKKYTRQIDSGSEDDVYPGYFTGEWDKKYAWEDEDKKEVASLFTSKAVPLSKEITVTTSLDTGDPDTLAFIFLAFFLMHKFRVNIFLAILGALVLVLIELLK